MARVGVRCASTCPASGVRPPAIWPRWTASAPRWRNGVAGSVGAMFGPNPEAFGHPGWGGSFGSADAENHIALGYVLNQMGDRAIGDPRGTDLANAVYACL